MHARKHHTPKRVQAGLPTAKLLCMSANGAVRLPIALQPCITIAKLRSRINNVVTAKNTVGDVSSSQCLENALHNQTTIFFPMDCMKALENHVILKHANVTLEGLHACVINMLQNCSASDNEVTQARSRSVCTECHLPLHLVYTRDGDALCDLCGILVTRESHTMPVRQSCSYVDQNTASCCLEPKMYFTEQLVEHWNAHFIQHPSYVLAEVKAYAHKCTKLHSSLNTKVIAALLLPVIKTQFATTDFQASSAVNSKLKRLCVAPPLPQYECPRCKEPLFEKYMIHKHPCRWGRGKQNINRNVVKRNRLHQIKPLHV